MQIEDKELQEIKEHFTDTIFEGTKTERYVNFLLSTIEGLKGEVTELTERLDTQRTATRMRQRHVETLQAEVERYRTALERTREVAKKCSVEIYMIADNVLKASQEPPFDTTRHGEDPMTGDRW